VQLHVAGALELLKDHLVHARAGVGQRRRQDRQRPALLELAGRAEQALGPVQRPRGDAARHDLAPGRRQGVAGAGQAGQRIQQEDDVGSRRDEARRMVHDILGGPAMLGRLLVEGGTDHFDRRPAHLLAHVGDFLRPLVEEQDEEPALGMIAEDGVGDLLKQHGLAGARRGDDQAALPLADRRQQVDDTRVQLGGRGFQHQAAARVNRRQVGERDAGGTGVRRDGVDDHVGDHGGPVQRACKHGDSPRTKRNGWKLDD
jgi:hypothetical protein